VRNKGLGNSGTVDPLGTHSQQVRNKGHCV
jgi:hypothetical protein